MPEKKIELLIQHPERLKWACRRGMLELDVLLRQFLDEAFTSLTMDEKRAFIQLLDAPDPDLFAWLMGSEVPTDPSLVPIVQRIRQHTHDRFQS